MNSSGTFEEDEKKIEMDMIVFEDFPYQKLFGNWC
jgi:hypothetical protein